jgi:DNA polymerase
MKESLTTGKQTYAFAKTDAGFKALLNHDSPEVQALATARLGLKSTLEETRTERFIAIASRGKLPVPIRYYAAHTGRWGGDDKINMQNLPSRGVDGKKLKKSIIAPAGYMLVDCDSSQIEARVLAWLADQQDLVQAFDKGEDVYKHMASDIYGVEVEDVTKEQRFVGKTAILGAGYGMGAQRFKEQLKAQSGVVISLDESRRIINVYRDKNWKITHFWRACQNMLVEMSRNSRGSFGFLNTVKFTTTGLDGRVHLPNGLYMRYDNLDYEQGERGPEFNYMTRKGRNRIYGGKVTENICQALARIIIGEQLLLISKKYKVTMTVHDSIVCAVPKKEIEEGQAYIEQCMRYVPTWCKGMPLDCESGFDKSYGGCE